MDQKLPLNRQRKNHEITSCHAFDSDTDDVVGSVLTSGTSNSEPVENKSRNRKSMMKLWQKSALAEGSRKVSSKIKSQHAWLNTTKETLYDHLKKKFSASSVEAKDEDY